MSKIYQNRGGTLTLVSDDDNAVHKTGDETIAGTKTFSSTITGSVSGNAGTATQFSANTTVALTGDATGTSAGSKKGWSVPVTLSNSGVTAGSYGPSANATPGYGATFNVPYITVDAKGRVTAAATHTVKIPASDNADVKVTQTVSTDNAELPILTKASNATSTVTDTSKFAAAVKINPSTGTLTATKFVGPLTGNVTGTCSGNAATATKLATARKINGVSFDGSADITVADSTKVAKAGDTMTGGLTITNSHTLVLKHTGITRGTAPSSNAYPFFVEFKDNADKTIGGLYYTYATDKVAKTYLMCYQGTTNENTWNSIGVGYNASGNVFTWAPTPATADNSTQIATTAFVKAQGYLTSHQSLANYSTLANTVKSISISGRTITVTPGSGNAYTLTTQDNNTTYSNFGKATANAAGTAGLVPAPAAGKQASYLRGDCTWSVPTNTFFASGTRMLFQQTSAPSGWTKETGSGYNNTALRLITGTVANKTDGKTFTACMASGRTSTSTTQGGTISKTTAGGTNANATQGGTVGDKTLTVAMLASHSHTVRLEDGSQTGAYADDSGDDDSNKTTNTGSTGSSSAHNHSFTGKAHTHTFTGTEHGHTFTGSGHTHKLDLDINYIDCIVAKYG